MRYNESRVRQTRQILPHRKDDGEMRKLTGRKDFITIAVANVTPRSNVRPSPAG